MQLRRPRELEFFFLHHRKPILLVQRNCCAERAGVCRLASPLRDFGGPIKAEATLSLKASRCAPAASVVHTLDGRELD